MSTCKWVFTFAYFTYPTDLINTRIQIVNMPPLTSRQVALYLNFKTNAATNVCKTNEQFNEMHQDFGFFK